MSRNQMSTFYVLQNRGAILVTAGLQLSITKQLGTWLSRGRQIQYDQEAQGLFPIFNESLNSIIE